MQSSLPKGVSVCRSQIGAGFALLTTAQYACSQLTSGRGLQQKACGLRLPQMHARQILSPSLHSQELAQMIGQELAQMNGQKLARMNCQVYHEGYTGSRKHTNSEGYMHLR